MEKGESSQWGLDTARHSAGDWGVCWLVLQIWGARLGDGGRGTAAGAGGFARQGWRCGNPLLRSTKGRKGCPLVSLGSGLCRSASPMVLSRSPRPCRLGFRGPLGFSGCRFGKMCNAQNVVQNIDNSMRGGYTMVKGRADV